MKTSSFTSTSVHNRCPRRYFYRYLHGREEGNPELKAHLFDLGKLMSHPEFLGNAVHESLASLVHLAVTEGVTHKETEEIRSKMLLQYETVFDRSEQSGRVRLPDGELQIAEIFNGHPCTTSRDDGIILLNHFFEKGCELVTLLGIGPTDKALVELEDSLHTRGGKFRVKVDLILWRGTDVWVIDWKTKEVLTSQDRHQLRIYMELIRRKYNTSPNRIFGLLASLRTGKIEKVSFNVFDPIAFSEPEKDQPVHIIHAANEPEEIKEKVNLQDRYPARPSATLCGGCSYALICEKRIGRSHED